MSDNILSTIGGREISRLQMPVDYTQHLRASYINNLMTAYNQVISETNYDYDKIPFILTTDQHSKLGESRMLGVYRLIADRFNLDAFSKVINLGDISQGATDADFELFEQIVGQIPLGKQINIYGNHDYGNSASVKKQDFLQKWFKSGGIKRGGGNGYFTAYDDEKMVKYIALNDFEFVNTERHYDGSCSTKQMKWFISEMSKNDGYDIIILAHNSWTAEDVTTPEGTVITHSTATKWEENPIVQADFLQMLADRKNKTSGSFTDAEGVTHSYDFSTCESELIFSMHGHWHTDFYKHMTNSITMVEYDCFKDDNDVYIGYVDRKNKEYFHVKVSEVGGISRLSLDLN